MPTPAIQVEVPSWVPNWADAIDTHFFVLWNEVTGSCAAGDTRIEVYFTNNQYMLDVRGVIVDSLNIVGSTPLIIKSTSLFELNDVVTNGLEDLRAYIE